jgi:hypothetical protein
MEKFQAAEENYNLSQSTSQIINTGTGGYLCTYDLYGSKL